MNNETFSLSKTSPKHTCKGAIVCVSSRAHEKHHTSLHILIDNSVLYFKLTCTCTCALSLKLNRLELDFGVIFQIASVDVGTRKPHVFRVLTHRLNISISHAIHKLHAY